MSPALLIVLRILSLKLTKLLNQKDIVLSYTLFW